MIAAGVLLLARSTGRVLLLQRSDLVSYPLTWAVPAGTVERDETPVAGAIRELREETGYGGKLAMLDLVAVHRPSERHEFHYVFASCPREFKPSLNWEHIGATWTLLNFLPQPLHPLFGHFLRYHGDAVIGALAELRH